MSALAAAPPSSRRPARLLTLALALLAVAGSAAAASGDDGYAARLAAEADRRGLAATRAWRSLLHVKPGLLGDRSLVDDPGFFLAPGGKDDPRAELRATLAAFLLPEPAGDDHPICRFPARFAWLREELGFDEAQLPAPACAAYRAFIAEADPRGVVLIFPVGYSNSPATMFGHTLLRIDSSARSDLLATAVSYAARTDTTFGILFALRGLFGLYDGYYYVNSYYEKINEYSHMESRDIWEYSLDLTPEEAGRLARHLWELKDRGSRYYFFDENCASNLLLLLEVARPSLSLADSPALWALPVDTIRRVLAAGIVTGVSYRPSRVTRLQAIAAPLPDASRALAVRIARGEVPPGAVEREASAGERARILDAATELHGSAFFARRVGKEEYSQRLIDILGVRSGYESARYAFPEPPRPEEGHGSLLVGAGVAVEGGEPAFALRARPVYHGLLDPVRGYRAGAAIAFGDTELRWREGEAPILERFHVIDILSLAPRDRFDAPTSWRVVIGFDRETAASGGSRTPFVLSWGGGWAARPFAGGILYALPGVEARAGGALEHSARGPLGVAPARRARRPLAYRARAGDRAREERRAAADDLARGGGRPSRDHGLSGLEPLPVGAGCHTGGNFQTVGSPRRYAPRDDAE